MNPMIDKRLMQEGKKVTGYILGTVIMGVGIALLAVGQAWLVAQIISQVFLEDASLTQVKKSLIWLLGIIVARAVLQIFSEISAREAAIRVKGNLRERFLTQLLTLGPLYTGGERAGELVNTAVEGIEALDEYFSRYIPQLVIAAFVPLLILGFVFPLDYKSGIVLLVTGPLIPFFMMLIGKLAEKKSLRQWQNLSRMSAHFLDMLQGLTTLKVFGRSLDQVRVIGRVSESFREATMGVLKIAFLSALVLEFLATISTALVAVTLGLRLINGTITFEDSLFLLLLAPEFYLPLRTLGAQFHARLSGVNAADRIFEVLDRDNQKDIIPIEKGDSERDPVEAGEKKEVALSFEHVGLRYDSGSEDVLKDFSFHIQPGERIALVGSSGSGKSSIFQILLRFIEATRGEVRVNGIPLREIPREHWWGKLAYVSQKPYLFAGTILDNLHIGRRNASFEEIVECAKKAFAHEFIMSLPQGYDTVIGEGGARLSGGQAQRLALARAFLKGAPLLLLDEATSSLDIESEREVQVALEELIEDRTVIFAAHRLCTVENADRIVVLEQGQIVEQGSHEELMERQGLYTRFVREYWGRAK
jgi:ATP-binding cassette subfamily C protein CydD